MAQLPKLILASGSPRRSEILSAVGWEFEKDVPEIDESILDGESPEEYVVRLARIKAAAVSERHPGKMVLGADTTVVIEGDIMGKPTDIADAERMIRMLSGNWHDVLTGIALVGDGRTVDDIERTRVK